MGVENSKTQVAWAPLSWFKSQIADESVVAYFGHTQNGYQIFRHKRLAIMLDSVASNLGRNALLDVGCATGALTERIRDRYSFQRAVGVDFVSEVVEMGRETFPEVEFQEATLPVLPFGDEEFDLVVASEVLYYLTPLAQSQALQEMARVLKMGGYLLISSALGGDYFTPTEARTLLERQFELVAIDSLRMHTYHTVVTPFYYGIRLNSLLTHDALPGSDKMQARYQRIRPLINSFPSRSLIKWLATLGKPVISSQWLPSVLNTLSRFGRQSNITLLGRKRANE